MDNAVRILRKTTFLFVLTLCATASAFAQSTRKLMKDGNKFFENENYRAALPFYEKVLAKEPNNETALFRAGVSYMAFDKEKASDYIYRAQKLKPKVSKDVEYWLGRVDHINYRFDDAINHYKAYDATLKKKKDSRKAEIAMLIQQSRNAKDLFNKPKDIFVKNLGPTINSQYSEHSPVISADDNYLLFTSRGEGVTGGKTAADGEYFEDIFEARRLGPDEWEQPRSLSSSLNGKGHDASIQIFDNDTKLLMYRQDENGDIFYSEKVDNNWTNPKKLNNNINTKAFESDAFITPDGRTMYFSTSHYSENGDLDIYVSQRAEGGDWGKPTSIGTTINTQYDDDSPYLSKDGKTLYFSSRGHNTMGGYDIFMTKYDSVARKWTKPENMGYPVNTPDDDTYYRLSPDGSYAYLSSYRIGGYGEKDIYTINYIRNVTIKGQVFSMRDSSTIPGVELVFNSQTADKRAISYRDITKPDSGNYSVNVLSGRKYSVVVTKDGKNITTEEFDVPVVTNDTTTIVKNFYVPYEDSSMVARAMKFKNIYFDTDKYKLRPESVRELDNIASVLKANPQVNISIEGHCDSRATDEYNMVLGDNRAKAAYEYLRKKGVSQARMVTVSYGERRPAVENDSPENMQLNRRTEFIVLNQPSRSTTGAGAGTMNRGTTSGSGTQQNIRPATGVMENGTMKVKTSKSGETKIKIENGKNEQKIEIEKDGEIKTKGKVKSGEDDKVKYKSETEPKK
ncbi:PD40 domain-containing protein [Adhaeribacter sp. BT258]|uniref:PD40 domain-containing protein n=1 Tax=Adhaeribacter terrigena TaxID=2793070 RepID=A0ABS1BY71_9BACT|nr:OmpA family protein [Adhaeribacter terrigena]MBK0402101.1 PD40 domain-containing protein [Adhaeribacter terrigena]